MVKSNKLKKLGIIAFTVAAMTFSSCNRNNNIHYSLFMPTNIEGWTKQDTLLYNIGKVGIGGEYERSIGMRISNNYPFKSLTIIIEQTVMPQAKVTKDTLECVFCDDNGNILGNGLSLYQFKFPIPAVRLNDNDSLSVRIWHHMRKEELEGVSDVGFELKKSLHTVGMTPSINTEEDK